MKKALIVSLCFIMVGLFMVNGTFALPNLDTVFQTFTDWLKGAPDLGGTVVDVDLVSDTSPQNLFPGGLVSRSAYVQNCGTGDVYFRLVYAVQYNADSWNQLDIRFVAENGFIEHDWQDIAIGSTPYKMKVFTYQNALPAGTNSPNVNVSIAMDADITSQQVAQYRSDFMKMQVLAIETASFNEKGFTTAELALNQALPLETLRPF